MDTEYAVPAAGRMSPEFAPRFSANIAQQAKLATARNYSRFYELDEEFHRLIAECGASTSVSRIVNGARNDTTGSRSLVFPVNNHLDIVLEEHRMILDALRRRDSALLATAMQRHLDRVFDTIRLLISERREYFSETSEAEVIRSAKPFRGERSHQSVDRVTRTTR